MLYLAVLSLLSSLNSCTLRQLGCYVDTPSRHALSGPDISLAGSNEDCGSKPKHCICGSEGPSGKSTACSTPCSGNVNEKCGGHEAVTVFAFKCTGKPNPPRPPSPSPSPHPSPAPPAPPPPGPVPWFPFRNTSLPLTARVADLVANLVTQAAGVDRLRLSPYYYDQECNSGIGVSFPQNIGMAASFNRTLLF
eukprot:gene13647-25240_t